MRIGKAMTLEDIHAMESINDDEDASTKMLRRAREQEQGRANLATVCRYLTIPKRDRTKAQTATLVKYLKQVKVFKDILLREGLSEKSESTSEHTEAAFE